MGDYAITLSVQIETQKPGTHWKYLELSFCEKSLTVGKLKAWERYQGHGGKNRISVLIQRNFSVIHTHTAS